MRARDSQRARVTEREREEGAPERPKGSLARRSLYILLSSLSPRLELDEAVPPPEEGGVRGFEAPRNGVENGGDTEGLGVAALERGVVDHAGLGLVYRPDRETETEGVCEARAACRNGAQSLWRGPGAEEGERNPTETRATSK